QSEGLANGSLFNLGGSGDDRLSAHYPDDGRYYFDVSYNGHTGRVDAGMNDPSTMIGHPDDLLFEAHSGNTSAGSAGQNYSDAAQAIFDNGAWVASGDTVQTPFSTGSEWNLARHGGAPGSPEGNFYQQAMYSEFLVYLAKDNSTAAPQTIIGTSGSDALTYSGEHGITTIDGMGGNDWLYLSGNVDLDAGSLTGGMKGIEHIRMDNGAANLLTLTDATLSANGAPVLTIAMDAGDAVLLNGTRYDHNADSLQTLIIGNDQGNVIVSTSANDRMIGGAGADTFTWLPGQAGRDTIENFSAAQHDKLDLSQLLQGFTGATRDQFIHKEVDAQGQVTLQVDAQGHGDFTQPDLTIVLEHVAPADPITVMTHAGNWVL
ncbi:MAG: type I secretion C-terminal target domain-containing protein, partial [Burkholderiaceae bacterium]